jgi:hypothetical protein
MMIELKPEQERLIHDHLATGLFRSVDDLLTAALTSLRKDDRFEPDRRRLAVRRMKEFGERHQLSSGEPITRKSLHEDHRF